MPHRIISTQIENEQGLIRVRDRTRQIGELCGLDDLQRTRFVTAVSEVARNCVQFAGGGAIEFWLHEATDESPQHLVAKAVDQGPGIANAEHLFDDAGSMRGRPKLGLAGARRLVDQFAIRNGEAGGTVVTLTMRLPLSVPAILPDQLSQLMVQLVRRREQTPSDELEQQNREMLLTLDVLRQRQVELQQADERKNEFLAMLAHELRNPLSAIRTALELINRKKDLNIEDTRRISAIISRQTDQLSRLVNGLLDVARVTQGKIDLEMKRLAVHELVDHAIEMTQSLIDKKGHAVHVHHAPDALHIEADPVRFKQVLGNLLHNAVRYTPPGGQIDVEIAREANEVVIRVRDNGMGIAPDILPRVFDLFTQAKTGLGRHDSGLGVGLTVVQRMVDEHGGTILAESAGLGQGSTFTVRMPLSVTLPLPALQPALLPPAASELRVLVVDDNVDAADMLQQMLTLLNYDVQITHSGEAGVAAAQSWRPDVAIIDIGLPGMNGFDVAAALRRQSATQTIHRIALSGYSAASVIDQGDATLFDHYLEKPAEVENLALLLHGLSARTD